MKGVKRYVLKPKGCAHLPNNILRDFRKNAFPGACRSAYADKRARLFLQCVEDGNLRGKIEVMSFLAIRNARNINSLFRNLKSCWKFYVLKIHCYSGKKGLKVPGF